MNARFYAPDAEAPGDVVVLPTDEAEHLTRVLRLHTGDVVRVFNGRGLEFEAVVADSGKQRVSVRIGPSRLPVPEPRVAVTVVHSVLKADKMDAVVRDAVMIGVTAIQPVVAKRSEISLAAVQRGRRCERWQRIAVSSTKQCGRAVVAAVREPRPLAWVPQAVSALALPAPALLLVEPGASTETTSLAELDLQTPSEATIVIGPEGGWTQDEIESLAGVCRPVSVGKRTLRADTIALIAVAALFAVWKEF